MGVDATRRLCEEKRGGGDDGGVLDMWGWVCVGVWVAEGEEDMDEARKGERGGDVVVV